MEVLFQSQKLNNGIETGYAIGFRTQVTSESNKKLIYHGGSSIGGRAFLLKVVEDNVIVALCANNDTGLFQTKNFDLPEVYQIAQCFF